MVRYRNLLLASEAFKATITSDIIAGIEADKDLNDIAEMNKPNDRWYSD